MRGELKSWASRKRRSPKRLRLLHCWSWKEHHTSRDQVPCGSLNMRTRQVEQLSKSDRILRLIYHRATLSSSKQTIYERSKRVILLQATKQYPHHPAALAKPPSHLLMTPDRSPSQRRNRQNVQMRLLRSKVAIRIIVVDAVDLAWVRGWFTFVCREAWRSLLETSAKCIRVE